MPESEPETNPVRGRSGNRPPRNKKREGGHRAPLTEDEIEKLRTMVNFVPKRDVSTRRKTGWAAKKED